MNEQFGWPFPGTPAPIVAQAEANDQRPFTAYTPAEHARPVEAKSGRVIRSRLPDGTVEEGNGIADARLTWWAKPNCRRCLGRGKQTYVQPSGHAREEVCDCVLRRMEGTR